jgi:chromosome segregation ATPase
MPKIINAEGTIVDLAGANALLEKLANLTTEHEALKTAATEAATALEAVRAENEELKSEAAQYATTLGELRDELEQAHRDKNAAETRVGELDAEIARTHAELLAATESVQTLGDERDALVVKLENAVAIGDAAVADCVAAESKLETIQKSLGVQGEIPTDVVDTDESAKEKAATAASDKIRAEYARLARSLRPDDRRKARKLLAEHSDAIKGYLARLANEDEPEPAPKAADGISPAEWADFNEWLADREYLRSKKASSLSTGERNQMSANSRIRYAKNKDLYDRCFKARE